MTWYFYGNHVSTGLSTLKVFASDFGRLFLQYCNHHSIHFLFLTLLLYFLFYKNVTVA